MKTKSLKHQRSILRNFAKGYLVGFRTRCRKLQDSPGLWPVEKRELRKIEATLNWMIHKWTKYPPKGPRKETPNV